MEVDVAIIGGGPAGASAAIALKDLGIPRVLLINREKTRRFKIGESAAPGVAALLGRLGLTSDLSPAGHLPYHGNCTLWGSDAPVFEDFALRGQAPGWHLDRTAFDRWLLQHAAACEAWIEQRSKFESIGIACDGRWLLRIRDASGTSCITAAAVIDASGRRAGVATQLGARRRQLDFLVAVATRLPPAGELLRNYSVVEAVAAGWWYAAEVPSGEAVVMFASDAEIAKAEQIRSRSNFAALLRQTEYLSHLLNSCDPNETPEVHPCYSQYSDRVAGTRWVAIGDAAIAMDPLTSSGISSALSDGLVAAEAIARSLQGDQEGLRDYARRCDEAVRRYLIEQKEIYQREGRWAEKEFWDRRHRDLPDNIGGLYRHRNTA